MSKKRRSVRRNSIKQSGPQLQNSDENIQNNLGNALGYPGSNSLVNFGQGYGGGNPYAPQISQVNTIFENLRWYLVSNFRQPLSEAYVELGLIQTIVDVPVDDALRGGIEIKSKQLSADQLQELQISVDRDDDLNTIGQACKWTRLFGGAGVLIIVDNQDYEAPLDINSITKDTVVEFRAVDMWELFWNQQNTDGYDPELQTEEFEFYNYYSHKIHKSRVMRMKGLIAPSFIRPRLRGWGFSVVEILIRSINQYLKATDLSFAVLDEFKVDIYKIKNLVNTLMAPDGGAKIASRIQMANWQKNYQNALVMDSEDDWDHKQLSFAGLAETMQGIRMQVAADMRFPITKLFGTSASAGLGNTDQNDLENYNAMVESQVRNKIKYDCLRLLEIKSQQLFGFVPDDLEIEFEPLRVLSAIDEETVKTSKFTRLMQASQLGKISDDQFIDACNKDNLLGIQLDPAPGLFNPVDGEVGDEVKEGDQNPDKPKDSEDPGANREDRRTLHTFERMKPMYNEAPKAESQAKDHGIPLNDPSNLESYDYQFDLMAYEADGADDWVSVQDMARYNEPLEQKLWKQAEELSLKYLRVNNLKYQIWAYRKLSGTFGHYGYDAQFDLMSYKAEGADDWINTAQMAYYEHPKDQKLWDEAKEASVKYLGSDNEKYRVWYYRKKLGDFSDTPTATKKNFLSKVFKTK